MARSELREIKFQDLSRLHLSIKSELTEAFNEVVESSAFVRGRHVQNFEKQFAAFTGASHCLGVGNGTDALELALVATGIRQGDAVLVPALTFAATAEAIVNVGAIPVFVDISEDSLCSTVHDFEIALKASKKEPRGIISVYLHGLAHQPQETATFVENFNLRWIEDCAQAHGAMVDERHVGTFSKAGTFSFFPGKNLGALGDAGAVITQDSVIAENIALLRDHGRADKYLHSIVGRNSRLDGLQAAFLTVKLKHLGTWNDNRRNIANRYFENLNRTVDGVRLISRPKSAEGHVYHNFVVRIIGQMGSRDRIADRLKQRGIETGVHYPVSLNAQPAFKTYSTRLEIADRVCQETLSLPIDPLMSLDDVDYISEELLSAVKVL